MILEEDLQQCALACPVAADHAQGMSFLEREADVAQRPDLLRPAALSPKPVQRICRRVREGPRGVILTEAIALAHPVDLDRMLLGHMTSANRRSVLWK